MGALGQAKTGGRKAGTPNKKTAALKQAVVEAVGALPDAFEGDSYAFLATVYKNQALPLGVRLDAAKAVISYERPRLANVAMTHALAGPIVRRGIFQGMGQRGIVLGAAWPAEALGNHGLERVVGRVT
jgi:hypothetical protein